MQLWKLAGSAAFLALCAANPALADVTPEEVWQSWQDVFTSAGSTVTTTSAARDGDTFVVTGFKASHDGAESKGETAIPEIRLRDKGDGTVELTLSDEASFSSTAPGIEGGKAMGAKGGMKMPGLVGTVSGSAEDMAYAFVMPSVDFAIEPTEDGQPVGKIGMLLSDSTSTYHLSGPAEAKVLDGAFTAASAAINLQIKDSGTDFSGSLNVADLSGSTKGSFAGIEEEEVAVALSKGFAIDSSLSYGALNYSFDINDENGPSQMVGGSAGGAFQIVMNAAQMILAGGGKQVEATLSSAALPFPEMKLSYAESAVNLTMPLSKSDAPQDFTVLVKLVDLQVSEELWGMFDPTGLLPHDPATVIIDTSGQAILKSDLMTTPEGATPAGEPLSFTVNDLTARIAGAELTGKGAFTFDNTDMTTFDGFPAPTGTMELKLTGANGLLDKLVKMGLLSPDDAMGARMMMAMFAKATAGEDLLTSVLEFKDKHFYANGQQLQ